MKRRHNLKARAAETTAARLATLLASASSWKVAGASVWLATAACTQSSSVQAMLSPVNAEAGVRDAGAKAKGPDAGFGPAPCKVHLPDSARSTDRCPAPPLRSGLECDEAEDATCVYGAVLQTGESEGVVTATCKATDTRHLWSIDNAPCSHVCPASAEALRIIDADGCSQRPLQSCGPGLTDQAQLDAMLKQVVEQSGFDLVLITEGTLMVNFEGGCPREIHPSRSVPAAAMEGLAAALGNVRWGCAVSVGCGRVAGPSTLVVP